ncbi:MULTISPECIES: plastocyanin/azurin family copper-binding protein [Haloferax]|nr:MULTISPECIES: plastocyanin/azurin family copper-binding protein [Haloferax]
MTTPEITRRGALRLTGGLLALGAMSGTATARDHHYGNGNGVGAFLNAKAQFKDSPIWTSGVANMKRQDVVEVDVGVLTPLDLPEGFAPPDVDVEGPFKFGPEAILVSAGTTVKWVWTGNPFELVDPNNPWAHDVVSLEMVNGAPLFQSPFQGTGTYEYTFDEPGTYLYYCTPHGYPYEDDSGFELNLIGMRGAVIVTRR